ncbi:MAG: hypothetical protein IPP51_04100 [Bacteroidetes bacterium]|nr:hypothetical protein [Bacteroidota bacterium]
MQIILTITYAVIFLFFIRKFSFFKVEGISPKAPSAIFLIKIAAGICLGLIYTYYYTDIKTTDTFKFFNDSKILYGSLKNSPWDFFRMISGYHADDADLRHYYLQMDSWLNNNMFVNDNRTIIRLNAFFCLFTIGHYYPNVVFLNFLSFSGLFCLYKVFISVLPERKKALLIFTFLFPSVLFWGSGLLKDGLLLFGLGLFLYQFHKLLTDKIDKSRIFFLLIGIAVLFLTKVYVIALLVPALFAWYLSNKLESIKPIYIFLASYLIYFVVAFNVYHIFPEYHLAAILYWKQWNFYGYALLMHSNSLIQIPLLDFNAITVIKYSPNAFANTLLRPSLLDISGNPLQLLAIAENTLILLLLSLPIFFYRKQNKASQNSLFLTACFLTITLFILIGLITPVLGAIVRYKIPGLPFLGFVLLYLTDILKLKKRIPILDKYL